MYDCSSELFCIILSSIINALFKSGLVPLCIPSESIRSDKTEWLNLFNILYPGMFRVANIVLGKLKNNEVSTLIGIIELISVSFFELYSKTLVMGSYIFSPI